MTDPFFIIGNPRSGTSVLRLMLCSHPLLFIPPECGFIIWWLDKYSNWSEQNTRDESSREGFVKDLLGSRKFETWGINSEELMDSITQYHPASYAELCKAVYVTWGKKHFSKAERWGDKNNFHVHHIRSLSSLFPESRFIHIVRDLRGVAASYQKLAKKNITERYAPDLPDEPEKIAEDWITNIAAVRRDFKPLPDHRKLEIRYEDLVSDPKATLSSICNLLDVDYHNDMMDFYKLNATLGLEPASFSAWKSKTWQKLDPSMATKWKEALSIDDINILESSGRQLLVQYGYL